MSSPSQTYLVLGASRGLGKGLATHLASNPSNQVIASVRSPNIDFSSYPNISKLILDQNNSSSVDQAAAQLSTPIDTLIINAAIGNNELILSTTEERWQEYFNTNILGPVRVINAFLPHLRRGKGKQIVLISSGSGSNQKQINNTKGYRGPYAVTKAAGNMLAIQLHNELHDTEGFTVVPIHPGWVATDMGNVMGEGGMPVDESARAVLKIVEELKLEDSAKFYSYDGSIMPW